LTIHCPVKNEGDKPVTTTYSDRLEIRNLTTGQTYPGLTRTLDPGTVGSLEPGAERSEYFDFRLPDGDPGIGTFEVKFITDYSGNIIEVNNQGTGESNNTLTQSSCLICAQGKAARICLGLALGWVCHRGCPGCRNMNSQNFCKVAQLHSL
jgi:hypothetical protein